VSIIKEISVMRYNEAVELPKFKASLDRLLNKPAYDSVLTTHNIPDQQDLSQFIERAISEGNVVLIEREWNGFMVILWRD